MISKSQQESGIEELLVFSVGVNDFGVDIKQTLGITRLSHITRVHHAPKCVRGIINLRGRVVTVLDLSVKFGGDSAEVTPESRIIVVRDQGEDIGLLADRVTDVIPMQRGSFEPPPANLGGVLGSFFVGVYREGSELVGILDVTSIIAVD